MADRGIEQGQFPPGEQTLDDHRHGPKADDEETVENQQVIKTGEGIVEHLPLAQRKDQHVPEPLSQPVEPVLSPSQSEQLEPAAQGIDDPSDADDTDDPEPDNPGNPQKNTGCRVMHVSSPSDACRRTFPPLDTRRPAAPHTPVMDEV